MSLSLLAERSFGMTVKIKNFNYFKVASHPKCDHFYDSNIDLTPTFALKKKFEKILFLREVMDKIVFSSLIAVNGMLTSHCDNLSTHHYLNTFDTQFHHGQTTQQ